MNKNFGKVVKSLTPKENTISTLSATTNSPKACLLNAIFTNSLLGLNVADFSEAVSHKWPDKFKCTEDEVYKLL